MAGLYSKNNLGEVQLNLKDALQKLYDTGIQEDLRLFAFANSIYSEVRSGVTRTNAETGQAEVIPNEIEGLINEPFTNESGQVIQRTKFVTNKFAFSSNNLVYFQKIGVPGFDQRAQYVDTDLTQSAQTGAANPTGSIKISGVSVSNTQRIIGDDGTVYYILDNAAAGGDFRISASSNGTALTEATGLTAAIDNITAAGGAAIRDPNPLGAPVVVSENGSIVSVQVAGSGSGYEIERTDRPGSFQPSTTYKIKEVGNFPWSTITNDANFPAPDSDGNQTVTAGYVFTTTGTFTQDNTKSGSAVRTIGTTTAQSVDVNVVGERSGASNAIIRLKILNGSISRTDLIEIVDGGSGYFADEPLKPVRQCRLNRFGQQETPQLQKCKNYSDFQDRLIHRSFKYTLPTGTDEIDYSTVVLGYEGSLVSSQYFYETKDAAEDGFFLYDPLTQKDLYLGQVYDQEVAIGTNVSTPSLLMRRFDTITSLNLLNIASLDSESRINDYDDNVFSVADSLGSQLRSLTDRVESIRQSFKTLLQNNKRQRVVTDELNTLGTDYNIFEGRNFDSTFRMIFRDPDGVVDRSDVEFGDLNSLDRGDQVETAADQTGGVSYHAPGMWLRTGSDADGNALYKRAFSTDAKPYASSKDRVVLSPILNKLVSGNYATGTFSVAAESGDNKYSISTAYLRNPGEFVQGFVSNIGTVVQNLSASPKEGGFVYHRTLQNPTIGTVKGYALFDYYDSTGNIRSPYILVAEQGLYDNETGNLI